MYVKPLGEGFLADAERFTGDTDSASDFHSERRVGSDGHEWSP